MSTNNKKITKVHGIVVVEQLSADERAMLRNVTLGHGKLKDAAIIIGVSRQTVYNAMSDGYDLDVDTLNAIRTFLQSKKQVA